MAEIIAWKLQNFSDRKILLIALAIVGVLLTLTAIPGIFIIDEDNYLVSVVALREGGFTIPGTEGLQPSRELVYFDPEANHRIVATTPVTFLVPPLYAFIALPFSVLGVRGLIFLNTLGFLITAFLVFVYVQKTSRQRLTPWISCAAFVLGGYSIEYAQGLWPQMLSAALCTTALFLIQSPDAKGFPLRAFFSGIVVGVATGVRQQNIIFAGCLGLLLLIMSKRRIAQSIGFTSGLLVPLIIISFIHLATLNFFHPFPSFFAYAQTIADQPQGSLVLQSLKVFWIKVVDFSTFSMLTDPAEISFMSKASSTGAVLIYGIVKKAWIQSSPWVGLALTGLISTWFLDRKNRSSLRQELIPLSLIVLPTLIIFSFAFNRVTDGLSFNQRYFLELVPVMAIAIGYVMDENVHRPLDLVIGFFVGVLLVELVLRNPSSHLMFLGQLKLPLIIAVLLILTWTLHRRSRILTVILSIGIGWSLFLHLETDVAGSRFRREVNSQRLEILRKTIPDHSALFTYWGMKDAAGPLQLERDIVILDVWPDSGKTAPHLVDELLAQNRRIFVQLIDFPKPVLTEMTVGRPSKRLSESYMDFIEILPDSGNP